MKKKSSLALNISLIISILLFLGSSITFIYLYSKYNMINDELNTVSTKKSNDETKLELLQEKKEKLIQELEETKENKKNELEELEVWKRMEEKLK